MLVATVAIVGFGVSMAFAAGAAKPPPKPKNPGNMHCEPGNVRLGGGCQLVFHDEHEPKGYAGKDRSGQQVCFTTQSPNQVFGQSGNCSLTNKDGKAYGVFVARAVGTWTVRATEAPENGVQEADVTTTVRVRS